MPILTIPIIIAFVAGGAVVGFFWKWEDIQYVLKGKKVAVLGARSVGKTTLLTYMSKGILISRYKQTTRSEGVERRRYKQGELDIRLSKTKDVSGSKDAYNEWRDLFSKNDIILYLIRTDELLNENQEIEARAITDLGQIREWIQEFQSKKLFFIVGNHWDTDPEFENAKKNNRLGNYQDKFNALPVVKNIQLLAGGKSKVKVALGSLATETDADLLISHIFTQVIEEERK